MDRAIKKNCTTFSIVGKFEQNLNPIRQEYLSDLKQINSDLIQQARIDKEYISLQKQITNRKK